MCSHLQLTNTFLVYLKGTPDGGQQVKYHVVKHEQSEQEG